MLNEDLIFVGIFIHLLGGISYIVDVLRGKIKPNRVSWGLWAFAVLIAFLAEIDQGVGVQSLATFMSGFIPLIIFLASFTNKEAYWKITRFDVACGALSVVGLILWRITGVGNLAILFSILADFLAGIPTLVKSYKHPETENWIEFLLSFVSMIIVLLTIRNWEFAYYGFPLYIIFFDVVIFLFVKFRLRKRIKNLL